MRTSDKAWIAGLLDGEGAIFISKQIRNSRPNPAYRVIICIANTVLEPLKFCESHYGGIITEEAVTYRWTLHSKGHREFLRDMMPFLKIKRLQALATLAYLKQIKKAEITTLEFKEKSYREVKELNKNKYGERNAKQK